MKIKTKKSSYVKKTFGTFVITVPRGHYSIETLQRWVSDAKILRAASNRALKQSMKELQTTKK